MAIYQPRQFKIDKDDLPEELPLSLKAFQDMDRELGEAPKPVNPGKIMVLRMLVIMGTLGAILLVLGMVAIAAESMM